MKIVNELDICAPPPAVFRWLTQRDKVRQWLNLLDCQITRDTTGRVGTMLREVYQVKRRQVELPVEVIAYQPNRRLVVRTKTRKQDTTFDYRVRRSHQGTRLTVVMTIRLLGYMKIVGLLAGAMIKGRIARGCQEDFGRLKQLCEQDSPSPQQLLIN
jgi:uncharacterized protein YndB with AHSA1/START domain